MRIIVTCMKNEGPFMLEWIAYHLSIGFEKFLIYTNDCTDQTDAIADRLAEMNIVEHLDNPRIGNQRPQAVAMRDMFKRDIVKDAEWVLFSDCDEFLNIRLGEGHLDDLFAAMGDDVVISPMWRLFGDAGIVDFDDKPVIEQFLRAAPEKRPVSVNSWGFKSMFRISDNIDRIGAHRPFYKDLDPVRGHWRAGNGDEMPAGLYEQGWRYTRPGGGYDWVQLNHYAVRSVDSFLVKCDRGHVLHTNKDIDLGYHQGMSHNHERDDTILRRVGPFQETLMMLKEDPVLHRLHAETVAHHRKRALELRTEYADLFDTLQKKAAQA